MRRVKKIPLRIGISALLTEGGQSGIGQYTYKIIEHLLQIDTINHYVVFALKGDQIVKSFDHPNLKIIYVSSLLRFPIVSILWHWVFLPILLSWEHINVLHLPTDRRLTLWAPCPIIVTAHDFAAIHNPQKYGILRHFYLRNFVLQLLKKASHIICVSHSTQNDIALFFYNSPSPTSSVIHNGVDHKLYVPLERQYCKNLINRKYGISFPFFLCVARLEHPGKNHIRLINAFLQFKKNHSSNHHLVLIGAPWNGAEKIYQAATSSEHSSDIHFLGFVQTQDLPFFYNACDLFILPSLWEGFGFPIIEAMACGAPIACSHIGSLPEIGGNFATFFNPYMEKEIRASMGTILGKSHSPKQQISDGRRWALSFTWENSAKKTLDIYESVTKRKS